MRCRSGKRELIRTTLREVLDGGEAAVILTGTPEGVMMGYPPEKQIYLQPGDEVTVETEKLGRLTNCMVAEEA
ncbi:Fumarylacetoacetate (FAA) hydrolase family protein [compost metagenome]